MKYIPLKHVYPKDIRTMSILAKSGATLNELCLILDCSVEDILKFEASKEEQEELALRKQEIEDRKSRHKKNKP